MIRVWKPVRLEIHSIDDIHTFCLKPLLIAIRNKSSVATADIKKAAGKRATGFQAHEPVDSIENAFVEKFLIIAQAVRDELLKIVFRDIFFHTHDRCTTIS